MARRLLVTVTLLFLVLLVLGSLVPTDSTQTDTSTTPLPPPDMQPTRTIEATLPGKDVRAQVGDLVTLTVESDVPGGVEMPAFGESAPVAPHAPAMFDVLPTQPGRYVVQNMQTGKPIGVLVVDDAPPGDQPGADPS
jgi:heme/copper-type cytochrome/quinol oxidase subunit 2